MASSSVPPATAPAAAGGPGPGFGFASKTKKKHFVQQKVKVFRAADPLVGVFLWGVAHSVRTGPGPQLLPLDLGHLGPASKAPRAATSPLPRFPAHHSPGSLRLSSGCRPLSLPLSFTPPLEFHLLHLKSSSVPWTPSCRVHPQATGTGQNPAPARGTLRGVATKGLLVRSGCESAGSVSGYYCLAKEVVGFPLHLAF